MQGNVKITAVAVVYNCSVNDSATMRSLARCYASTPASFSDFHLVIFDNGPDDQSSHSVQPFSSEYVHHPENAGLAKAYNYALERSEENGSDWLLLLDQDSALPEKFIDVLFATIAEHSANRLIASFVPAMYFRDEIFSPSKVLRGGIHRPVAESYRGLSTSNIAAPGSCTAVRVATVRSLGGFNEFFWMDCLDRWLYLQIFRKGLKVFVTDIKVNHELSVLDYDMYMNENRYRNIMFYESCFMKFYMPLYDNMIYILRLLRRAAALLIKPGRRKYALLTFRHLAEILFIPGSEIRKAKINLTY